ncbi:MAG: GPR endopeptidase [Lachnospiraceae bacterium]|nr:GPR endopeptidase [Lachnospiraceae bacterium]
MNSFGIRTDLALEAREGMVRAGEKLHGVRTQEYEYEKAGVRVTKVFVETKNAANQLGKPIGCYVTMEADSLGEPDEGYHREISECFRKELCQLVEEKKKKEEMAILVIGLGNRDVTADSLGPRILDNLFVTRHMVKLYGAAAVGERTVHLISALEPGVMAKTGMETAEIVSGVIKETKPDLLIVADALAARSTKRLNRTIQITDVGIQPGSGVGNHRNALTQESLGIPVIAIGVPTVVDAATIVGDALERLLGTEKIFRRSSFADLNNMYVTGKDVDEVVKRISFTISEGINAAFHAEGE